jgi:hypothetical protein
VYFEYNGDKYYLDECMTIGCDWVCQCIR